MRTHKHIIESLGVPEIRRRLAGLGVSVSDPTVRSWARRDSIPASYWLAFTEGDIATVQELLSSKVAA